MKPLVSILIPAYNAEKWLADSLQSAINQTWDRKEIVIVDDGSKDGTLALAKKFESDTIKVFTQPNQGAAAARNKAFSLCKGDYIQWLDADDLLAPDKISEQMKILQDSPDKKTLVCAGWARFMNRPQQAKFNPSPLWCDLPKAEWMVRKMGQNLYMQTACWLVSREMTEAAGPWDTRLLGDDDGEYFGRVLLASDRIRFAPASKVYYRIAGSASLSYIGTSNKKRDAQWLSMELHMKYLRSLEDSERSRAACVKFMQTWMVYFYPERMDIFAKAQAIAKELGGEVHPPHMSWKYTWIKNLFGMPLARRAQVALPRFRWSLVRFWDKTLFRLGNRGLSGI